MTDKKKVDDLVPSAVFFVDDSDSVYLVLWNSEKETYAIQQGYKVDG